MADRPSGSLVGPAKSESPFWGSSHFVTRVQVRVSPVPKWLPTVFGRDGHFEDPDAFRWGPACLDSGSAPQRQTAILFWDCTLRLY